MHAVIETPAYLASAKDEGVSDAERANIVSIIAREPNGGAVMPGTGGARKRRIAGRGKGKSGGYRIVTFYGGEDMPVFLLDIFGKDSKANLTKAERNELRQILTDLPKVWRENVRTHVEKMRRGK